MISSVIGSRLFDPLRERAATLVDGRRLFACQPAFGRDYYERMRVVQDRLRDSYTSYKSCVSPGGSAVSFESACFLYLWCETYRPNFILDLGSGYSSYVFRLYKSEFEDRPTVFSVDSSVEWLDKTREYLAQNHLSQENLISSNFLSGVELAGLDFAFFDIRPLDMRIALLPAVFAKLNEGGAIIVDDMHKRHFRPGIRRAAAHLPGHLFSLKRFTLDSYGRYAYMLLKQFKPEPTPRHWRGSSANSVTSA